MSRDSHIDAALFMNDDSTPNMDAVVKALRFIENSYGDLEYCRECHVMLGDIVEVLESIW
jgi:hypothetical protein